MVSVVWLDVDRGGAVWMGALSLREMGLCAQSLVLGAVRQYRAGVRLALATASCGFLRMGRSLQPRLSRRILRRLLGRVPRRTIRMAGLVPAVATRQALWSDARPAPARSARKLPRAGRCQRNGRAKVPRWPRGGFT